MNYRKNKTIFIILSALTLISLFGVSAVCNLCGATTGITDITSEEETTAADATTSTTAGSTTTTDTAADTTADESKAPTIKLSIYEGPTYAEDSGVCYYRIKATLTGNPTPNVKFSKDDSGGTLGKTNCQVNINNPGDTYTLTAVAINSVGEASDTLELSWGCEEVNSDPVIDSMAVVLLEERLYISSESTLESHATDPDGDSLTYLWEVTGGTIANSGSQNTTWTMPSAPGDYTVTLTVTDGKGGEDNKSAVKQVVSLVYDFMAGAPGAYWTTNAGVIPFGGATSDDRGFAIFVNNITLEDGITYTRVLETHPRWINDGWISGAFPNLSEHINIPAGAKFKAKVGFMDGLTATDGAYFRLYFYDGTNWYRFPSPTGIHCANDGTLNDLNIDLSSIAGKSGIAYLQVDAGGASSAQDWAVWVDPIITK